MCINKTELMTTCGLGLLLQLLDMPTESKLHKDTQLSLAAVMKVMDDAGAPSAATFKKLGTSLMAPPEFVKPESRRSSSSSTGRPAAQEIPKSSKGHLQAIVDRFSFTNFRQPKLKSPYLKQEASASCDINPALSNNLAMWSRMKGNNSSASLSSSASDPVLKSRSSRGSMPSALPQWSAVPNLDYLPLGSQSPNNSNSSACARQNGGSPEFADWDHLVTSFDPFDISSSSSQPQLSATHRSPPSAMVATGIPPSSCYTSPPMPLDWTAVAAGADWSAGEWGLLDVLQQDPMSAKSVLSLSDESLTSGEELSSCDLGSEFRGYSIPHEDYRQDGLGAQQAAALS